MKTILILLLSGLEWGKLATTGGTMLLSLAIYATIWGWRYAAGFIALLFVHEMGHYIAARQRGLAVGRRPSFPSWEPWSRSRRGRRTSRPRPMSRLQDPWSVPSEHLWCICGRDPRTADC